MGRIQPLITRLRSYTARISPVSYTLYYDCFLADRIRWKTAKHGLKMKYLTVYGRAKYDHNKVHTKRAKYDRKRPFTIGHVWPGYTKHRIYVVTMPYYYHVPECAVRITNRAKTARLFRLRTVLWSYIQPFTDRVIRPGIYFLVQYSNW